MLWKIWIYFYRDASANLSRKRADTFYVEADSRNLSVPANDARRLLDHVSYFDYPRLRGRDDRRQYENSYLNDRNISPRSRNDIHVRVDNDKIPDLMDLMPHNKAAHERKRKGDFYEEPLRKDMKVIIHQDLDPNILARENPLRVNLRQDRERSRHLADLVVNEALDRGYDYGSDMESRDIPQRGRFPGYEARMSYGEIDARYRSISSERRAASLGRRMSSEEYLPTDEYFHAEAERRQRVQNYADPYYDRYSPGRERYSPARDPYSPDLAKMRDPGYLNRLSYDDRLISRSTSNVRNEYLLDSHQMATREDVSRLRNLNHARVTVEREMEVSRVRDRKLPGTSHQRVGNYDYAEQRSNKPPPQQRAKVPVETSNRSFEKVEFSGEPTSKRSDLRKTAVGSVKKPGDTKVEAKAQKPVIPKFQQLIDVSLKNSVAEMTPKKRADFKMQELEVMPVCSERTLNERFSGILSVVWRFLQTFLNLSNWYLFTILSSFCEYVCV